ncbi:hypothetical protein [Deinococcus marmoris]|nr:hypothetical protein [Deinococcus marmoris]
MHITLTPPALTITAPASWLDLADTISARHDAAEKDAWTQQRDTAAAHALWEQSGKPGGSFFSAVNARRDMQGLKPYGKSLLYGWLRGGEALARGLTCATPSEATAAGYALQDALVGSTVTAAVAEVQGQVDAGKHRRKAAPSAPDGCTFRAVPLEAIDTLDALQERLARVAGEQRIEMPTGAPEQLAALITAVSALPDAGLAALLGAQDHVLIHIDVLRELQRRAGAD